jgi:hypothetical protein
MTPAERIKHEFLLLQGRLGDDAQFFHLDRCPNPMPESFQVTLDALFWNGITDEEMALNCVAGRLKHLLLHRLLQLCKDGEDKMIELIDILQKEVTDAEEAKNIGTEESG